jgi:hypothetical protein
MDPDALWVREFAKKPDELTHEEELLTDYLEEIYCVPPVMVTFSLVTGPLNMLRWLKSCARSTASSAASPSDSTPSTPRTGTA